MLMQETAAVITGGASGLGEATARLFRASGAQVTILDRDAARGEAVAAEIGAHFVSTDVTSEDSVKAAIAHAVQKMGKINAAINCAGIGTAEKTLGKEGPHSLDHYNRVIGINLVGTFNVARLAAAEMAKNDPSEDVICPRRLGRPEEYAQLARFIVESGYLNGETIRIDGALRMR